MPSAVESQKPWPIQLANGVGLLRRLEPAVDRWKSHPHDTHQQKLEFSRKTFGAKSPFRQPVCFSTEFGPSSSGEGAFGWVVGAGWV